MRKILTYVLAYMLLIRREMSGKIGFILLTKIVDVAKDCDKLFYHGKAPFLINGFVVIIILSDFQVLFLLFSLFISSNSR